MLAAGWRWLTRLVVTAHTALVFAQPVFAGRFIDGEFDYLAVHSGIGGGLIPLAMLQAVMVLGLWWLDRRPWWGAALAPLLVVAVIVQVGAGHAGQLALHVPLGTAIVAAAALLLGWAWQPAPAAVSARRTLTARRRG